MPRRPLIFICPRVPHPLNTGAKIRTRAILGALAGEYEIHYIGYRQPELNAAEAREQLEFCAGVELWPEPATSLPGKLWLAARSLPDPRPATMVKYASWPVALAVRRKLAQFPNAVLHADHLHMAEAMQDCAGALRVIDEHNVEAQIVERSAELFAPRGALSKMAGPAVRAMLRSQAKKMRRHEGARLNEADLGLAVSPEDAAQLRVMAPHTQIEVIPNGVDEAYFSPNGPGDSRIPGRLVFTGSMSWLPNQDAVVWFCREVLPILRERHGADRTWSLDIVGLSPPASVRELAGPGVRVTGGVPDVRPYAREAEVFIVPIRIGGGSRLKILEAFAMGAPVVSTAVGCEGLGAVHEGNLLIADTPADFAAAVDRLAKDEKLKRALAERARAHVLATMTWGAVGRRLLELVESRLQ